MGEPFNRAGQVFPANQPGVGTQYDPKPVPTGADPVTGPETTVAPVSVAVAPAPVSPVGPDHYADGTPRPAPAAPAAPIGATGESFLQHLEDEIKAHI